MTTRTVGDFPIKGKIVLITGGGSGIGLALTKLAHSRGARVVVGDLKLTPEAESFVSSHTSDICFQKCDVSSWPDLAALNTASLKHFSAVPDVYVPNAGIFEPPWSNFWDDTEEQGYKTMEINVNHPIKITRLAMRALLGANKKGVVCLVASGAGLMGFYPTALYCASKAAVVGFAKSMGLADQEEGVKVVCICPGEDAVPDPEAWPQVVPASGTRCLSVRLSAVAVAEARTTTLMRAYASMVASPLWTDREDDRAKAMNYGKVPMLQPEDIAETIVKLIEDGKYGGGTVMVKAVGIEEVVFDLDSQIGQGSPAAQVGLPDISHMKAVMDQERGKPWKA